MTPTSRRTLSTSASRTATRMAVSPERLVQAGYRLKAKEKEVNIEDVFMRITKGITS